VQANRFGGIVVIDREKLAIDTDFYSNFFLDFALKCAFE
jgi:hypothetical protein